MTNIIIKKIDKIFSSELEHNRNLILTKEKGSNTLIKNKCKNKIEDNFGIFKIFNKRQSDQDDNYKGHIKLINNNKGIQKDIDKNNTNKNKKAILKKETDTEVKNFLEDEDSPINDRQINRDKIIINSYNDKNYSSPESYIKGQQGKESKKGKKTRFYVKPKTEEKNNNSKFKRKKTRKKKSIKNIVMIEKQKYPKKETIFDRINRRINEAKNNIENSDNISEKKQKIKNSTIIKPKNIFTKSTKIENCKLNNSIKIKYPSINIKLIQKKEINPDNDSSNFIMKNHDSVNSNNKTVKTCERKKGNTLKLFMSNNDSDKDAYQSSRFSKSSDSKENNLSKLNDNTKSDIMSKHSFKDNNKIKNIRVVSSFHKDFKKYSSGKIPHLLFIKDNNMLDDKSNNKSYTKSKFSKQNSISPSVSNNIDSENNKTDKEIETKIFDHNDDVDIDESKNKKIQNKYNHKKGDGLAIIPEGENKKILYEDIKRNIKIIKPENIIMLEQNYNDDKTKRRNIEIQKNNIIINNNVSNNITVHNKKELDDTKKDDYKNEDENTNKNIEKSKRKKQYVVKARKKFPFCCL